MHEVTRLSGFTKAPWQLGRNLGRKEKICVVLTPVQSVQLSEQWLQFHFAQKPANREPSPALRTQERHHSEALRATAPHPRLTAPLSPRWPRTRAQQEGPTLDSRPLFSAPLPSRSGAQSRESKHHPLSEGGAGGCRQTAGRPD